MKNILTTSVNLHDLSIMELVVLLTEKRIVNSQTKTWDDIDTNISNDLILQEISQRIR